MGGGMKAAASAMEAYVRAQEINARNIANAVTPGFKRNMALFAANQGSSSGPGIAAAGGADLGVGLSDVRVDFHQGQLQRTGNDLDLAIQGDGFFTVQGEKGVVYTRDGGFSLNKDGILVTRDNRPVLSESGEIQAPPAAKQVTVREDGRVFAGAQQIGKLKIVAFDQTEKLRDVGASRFRDDGAGPRAPSELKVVQGSLEAANVEPVTEMVRMIANMRGYEACSQSIQAIRKSAANLYAWARQ